MVYVHLYLHGTARVFIFPRQIARPSLLRVRDNLNYLKNRVCKRTQHVASKNAWSCWPTMLRPFARGWKLWYRKPRKIEHTVSVPLSCVLWGGHELIWRDKSVFLFSYFKVMPLKRRERFTMEETRNSTTEYWTLWETKTVKVDQLHW